MLTFYHFERPLRLKYTYRMKLSIRQIFVKLRYYKNVNKCFAMDNFLKLHLNA